MLKDVYPYYVANRPSTEGDQRDIVDKYSGEVAAKYTVAPQAAIEEGIAKAVTAAKPLREMAAFERQAVRFGTRIVTDDGLNPDVSDPDDGHSAKYHDCKSVDLSKRPFEVVGEDGTVYRAHTVIIATGATANWLGLENEQRLARSGGGVSACAVCDGAMPRFRNQELAVVGGGE